MESGSSVLAHLITLERGSSSVSMPLRAEDCCLSTSLVVGSMVKPVVEGPAAAGGTEESASGVPASPPEIDLREPDLGRGVESAEPAAVDAPPVDFLGIFQVVMQRSCCKLLSEEVDLCNENRFENVLSACSMLPFKIAR